MVFYAAPLMVNYILGALLFMTADFWEYRPDRTIRPGSVQDVALRWTDDLAQTPLLQAAGRGVARAADAFEQAMLGPPRWAFGAAFALTAPVWALAHCRHRGNQLGGRAGPAQPVWLRRAPDLPPLGRYPRPRGLRVRLDHAPAPRRRLLWKPVPYHRRQHLRCKRPHLSLAVPRPTSRLPVRESVTASRSSPWSGPPTVGFYASRWNDPAVIEAFGQDTAPDAFTSEADPEEVLRYITRKNPDYEVVLIATPDEHRTAYGP